MYAKHTPRMYPSANLLLFILEWLIPAGAGMGVVADAFITAVLVNLLRSKHIGVKRYSYKWSFVTLFSASEGFEAPCPLESSIDIASLGFPLTCRYRVWTTRRNWFEEFECS